MEATQVTQTLVVLLSCLFLVTVTCEDSQPDSTLDEMRPSQPKKRSIIDLPSGVVSSYPALYPDSDDLLDDDKRSSLFRFGKRGSLFRFGKRGSLFRFGKRSSLFRFGKRGSLFRFGKRNEGESDDGWLLYPGYDVPADDLKREVKSFHWGRETDE